MKKDFFEVLYYLKRGQFKDLNDVQTARQFADRINKGDQNTRKKLLVTWLAQNDLLSKAVIDKINKFAEWGRPGNYEALEKLVSKCYELLQNFDYDNTKTETYRTILQMAVKTEGRFLDQNNPVLELPDQDSKLFSEEQTEQLMKVLSKMSMQSEEQYSLSVIIELMYRFGLTGIRWNNFSNTVKDSVFEPLGVFSYLVRCLKNPKKFEGIQNKVLYSVLVHIGDFDSDESFFSSLQKADRNRVIDIDYTGVTNMIERLRQSFEDKDVVISVINWELQLPKAMNKLFGAMDGVENIEEYLQGVIDNKIKSVEKTDEKLNTFIQECIKSCSTLERDLVEYKQMLNKELRIETVDITLKDALERWQGFFKTNIYHVFFGNKLDHNMNDIAERMVSQMDDDAKKYISERDVVTPFSKLLTHINTTKLDFSSVAYACQGNPDRMSIKQKIAAVLELLNIVEKVLTSNVTFIKKQDVDKMVKKPEMNGNGEHEDDGSYQYWNAACTLVYLKDSHVSESFQPETEMMLYEDTVILESTDWEKYFNKLYDVIRASIKDNNNIKDVFDYIEKTDSLSDDNQESGPSMELVQAAKAVINAAETANQQSKEAAGTIKDTQQQTMPKNPAEGQNIFEK